MYTNLAIDLQGKKISIIGAGPVALRRVKTLIKSGAEIQVISPRFEEGFEELDLECIKDTYNKEYIRNSLVVIAATDDRQVNLQIYRDCKELDILVNMVDGSVKSEIIFPAQALDGRLSISVSTDGLYPLLSKKIKHEVKEKYSRYTDEYLAILEEIRAIVLENYKDRKNKILSEVLELDLAEVKNYRNRLKEER